MSNAASMSTHSTIYIIVADRRDGSAARVVESICYKWCGGYERGCSKIPAMEVTLICVKCEGGGERIQTYKLRLKLNTLNVITNH